MWDHQKPVLSTACNEILTRVVGLLFDPLLCLQIGSDDAGGPRGCLTMITDLFAKEHIWTQQGGSTPHAWCLSLSAPWFIQFCHIHEACKVVDSESTTCISGAGPEGSELFTLADTSTDLYRFQ